MTKVEAAQLEALEAFNAYNDLSRVLARVEYAARAAKIRYDDAVKELEHQLNVKWIDDHAKEWGLMNP